MCKKGPPAVWTKEKIEEAFAGFVEKNRRLPVAREMKPQYDMYPEFWTHKKLN